MVEWIIIGYLISVLLIIFICIIKTQLLELKECFFCLLLSLTWFIAIPFILIREKIRLKKQKKKLKKLLTQLKSKVM